MADRRFPFKFAALSRLRWFDATVLDAFLSCLSLLPVAGAAEPPVNFTGCCHAYMRLRTEQGTVSDRFFHGICSPLIRPVPGAAAAVALVPGAGAIK